MTDALRATYHTFKLVPSRSVAQIVLEIGIEQAEAALDLLGIPQPGKPTWVGIARLNDSAAVTSAPLCPDQALPESDGVAPEAGSGAAGRPAQHPLVRLAGILPNDERFRKWTGLKAMAHGYEDEGFLREEDVADWLRHECGIASRRELATNPDAAAKFEALVARYRQDTGQSTWERPA